MVYHIIKEVGSKKKFKVIWGRYANSKSSRKWKKPSTQANKLSKYHVSQIDCQADFLDSKTDILGNRWNRLSSQTDRFYSQMECLDT